MTEDLAKLIVFSGVAVGIVLWYFAFRLYVKMRLLPNMVSSTASMSGKDADAGMKDLVAFAATQGRAHIGNKSPTTLELKLGASEFAFLFVKVLARFDSRGGQTVFRTVADFQKVDKPFKLAMAILVLLVTPLFVLGIPIALWLFIVPNDVPAVRWQVLQVFQILNFVWEPFVIYVIHRRYRMLGQTFMNNVETVVTA